MKIVKTILLQQKRKKKDLIVQKPGIVVHTCNPSYGRDGGKMILLWSKAGSRQKV
jgi:hypothetical protein